MRIQRSPDGEDSGAAVADNDTEADIQTDEGTDTEPVEADADTDAEPPPQETASDEAAPEEAGDKPAKSDAPATTFSPALIAKAARLGVSDEELAEIESPAELERYVKNIERRSQKPEDKKDSTVQRGDEVKVEDIPDLNPEEYDEVIVKGWKAMKGIISQLNGQNKSMRETHRQREAEEYATWFDGQLTALPEGEAVFGKGRGDELDAKSEHFVNRDKLWRALSRLEQGHLARGEKMPSRNELLKQAHRLAFGENIAAAARRDLASHLQKRKGQQTLPPTQRNGLDGRSSDEKAKSSIARMLKQKGLKTR